MIIEDRVPFCRFTPDARDGEQFVIGQAEPGACLHTLLTFGLCELRHRNEASPRVKARLPESTVELVGPRVVHRLGLQGLAVSGQ